MQVPRRGRARNSVSLLMRRSLSCAEQINEQPVCSRNPCRQLPEKCQAGINVNPLAVLRVDEAARGVRFSWIVHGEHGVVARVEMLTEEIEAAFLDPAAEIILRNAVRKTQQRAGRVKEA